MKKPSRKTKKTNRFEMMNRLDAQRPSQFFGEDAIRLAAEYVETAWKVCPRRFERDLREQIKGIKALRRSLRAIRSSA